MHTHFSRIHANQTSMSNQISTLRTIHLAISLISRFVIDIPAASNAKYSLHCEPPEATCHDISGSWHNSIVS